MKITILVGTTTDPDNKNEDYLFAAHKTKKGFVLISKEKSTSLDSLMECIDAYVVKTKKTGANVTTLENSETITIGGDEKERYYVTPLGATELIGLKLQEVT